MTKTEMAIVAASLASNMPTNRDAPDFTARYNAWVALVRDVFALCAQSEGR